MMRYLSDVLRALVAIALVGSTALAQGSTKAPTREGFWIGFGLGAGSAGLSCDGCEVDRSNGFSGSLRMGGTLTPNLLIGGETNGWVKSEDDVDEKVGFLTANAYYYPQASGGFFLKGGLGLATSSMEGDDGFGGYAKLESIGFGVQLGAGYDIRVSRNLSLTPYANYLRAFSAEAKFNGSSLGENLNPNLFQAGVGLTWH